MTAKKSRNIERLESMPTKFATSTFLIFSNLSCMSGLVRLFSKTKKPTVNIIPGMRNATFQERSNLKLELQSGIVE